MSLIIMYNIGLEPLFLSSWLAFPHPLDGLFCTKIIFFSNNFKSITPRVFKFGMWIDKVFKAKTMSYCVPQSAI